ncbi:hypothetical protein GPECTOR_1g823 [Gonium pectorale]|uniref:Uncharacterized protein n=1 Tax=Gonium pectorale TaxID=33097 RepID=A0A150H4C6_GONPE|nr:hypothetical protein GPECTOR_1g823 [Gonium pectorale]|eukprot:KXZ56913.1 hypothetical protein GPECTOR_1g823 [Gonium pectorale]
MRLPRPRRRCRPSSQGSAEHVASLATHLSRLRVRAPRLWEALGNAAAATLESARPSDVAALMAAYARAELTNELLFDRAVAQATADMRGAEPEDVATVLWALARSGITCPRSLRRAVAAHLAARGRDYGLLHVASMAGACAKMGVRDGGLHRLLAERGAQALDEEANALGIIPQPLIARPTSSAAIAATNAPAATSHAVSVLVAGLRDMEPHARLTGLLRSAVRFLVKAARAGGAVSPAQAEQRHVDQVAAACLQAGLAEEYQALLQTSW